MRKQIILFFTLLSISSCFAFPRVTRQIIDFNQNWKFKLNDTIVSGFDIRLDDSQWRTLNLPHDWSIESDFMENFPATAGGGALPGGLGWYRKTFTINETDKKKQVFIEFDGVYRNSEVWVNGISIGKRPNGYVSFRYDITPYIKTDAQNLIAVRVDNSKQPNSRWYSGSGIYRNVRMVITNPLHVDLWGTFITTPNINTDITEIAVECTVKNDLDEQNNVKVEQILYDEKRNFITKTSGNIIIAPHSSRPLLQSIMVPNPVLWSIDQPYLYNLVTKVFVKGLLKDEYETTLGIRSINFDVEKGFFLNGKSVKINGVCNHHDLGALGAAVNVRALERQLEILKRMGVNAIRTAHNPPAPELLELCDRMGFLVMNEAFDMWKKRKTKYDYSSDFDEWHERDLVDQIKRDRNHPSVIIWSIGNEVNEQWNDMPADELDFQQANIALNKNKINLTAGSLGKNALLTRHLVDITKKTDPTRPVTAACNATYDNNPLFKSESLDLIGFNYHEHEYEKITTRYPKTPFIATETVSSLHTRGNYEFPSDSVRIWPVRSGVKFDKPSHFCSAFDNCRTPWGSTHENNLQIIKKHPHISGQFIWTGFDYLGEPTPFSWPSRSSFFGIVDLAGFPKDVYYLYQSEWSNKDMLHVFPHWNWEKGQTIDIWAYYNHADEVELFLNGISMGKRSKQNDEMHVMWRVNFEPGRLKAVSRKNGNVVYIRDVVTAAEPQKILLTVDRKEIKADGKDLSFVTVEMLDKNGYPNPLASQLVKFSVEGEGFIAGTDNGNQNDHNSLKKPERHLFNGKCLAIIQHNGGIGEIKMKATVEGFKDEIITILCK